MFAKMEGASLVVVSETNEARGNKAVSLGVADEWVDARSQDMVPNMLAKTNGGFDKVIECCGNAPAVTSAILVVKPGGRVVLAGVSLDAITIPTALAVTKELDLQGAIAYTKKEFQECIDLMSNKQIDVLKFKDDLVSLEDVQASYERLTSGTDAAIKILVDPNM